MPAATLELTCPRCDGIRKHRYTESLNYWVCQACGTPSTLGVNRAVQYEQRGAAIMSIIPEELEKGPWEGHDVCSTCLQDLSAQDYYLNKCVCPHCGVCNASGDGSQGLKVITRRKVFFAVAIRSSWWQRLFGIVEVGRDFEWEIKESRCRM